MSQPIPEHIVLRIRAEWDARSIDTRAWANALNMNPETIRRIGRRDTYRHVGRENSTAILAPLGVVNRGFNSPSDEPDEAEIAASLARLQERMEAARAEPKVDDLLEEMAKKGREEGQ
jgi:hypothetical protein